MIGSSFQRYVQIILKIFYPVFNTFECQLFYFKSALKLEQHVLEQQILYMNSMQGICLWILSQVQLNFYSLKKVF